MPFIRDPLLYSSRQGLRTPREEIAFTARPKIHSHSQIFRYGGSIFCLPHRPIFSDILDLCLHWVSVVRGPKQYVTDYFLHRHKIPYETMKLFTTPIAEIIWVKNVRAIFVCGFLMK